MNARLIFAVAAAFILGLLIANTFFIVDQRQQVVVVNLGEPVRVINPPGAYDPGLKIKAPWESLVTLDKRNQVLEAHQEEVISADQERLVVDAFVRYRISNPLAFYRTLRNESTAADRLEPLINSSLRQVLGWLRRRQSNCMLVISASIFASLFWMIWKPASGRPNCVRVLT